MRKYLLTATVCLAVTLAGMFAIDATAEEITEPVLEVWDIVPQEDLTAEAAAYLAGKGVNVPENVIMECEAAGANYNICPELLEALCWKESRFTPTAKNGSFVGMTQMHKRIHAERLSWFGNDPFDTHASIWAAASLLHDLSEDSGTEETAEIATILGRFHGEKHPEENTSSYTEEILKISAALERVHGK